MPYSPLVDNWLTFQTDIVIRDPTNESTKWLSLFFFFFSTGGTTTSLLLLKKLYIDATDAQ